MPCQSLQVLGCGCQIELFGDVPQSPQSCLAQLNLLLEFGEQSLHLVTRSLGTLVIQRTCQRANCLSRWLLTEQDIAAVHQAFFEAVFEPEEASKFTNDDLKFLSALKISTK